MKPLSSMMLHHALKGVKLQDDEVPRRDSSAFSTSSLPFVRRHCVSSSTTQQRPHSDRISQTTSATRRRRGRHGNSRTSGAFQQQSWSSSTSNTATTVASLTPPKLRLTEVSRHREKCPGARSDQTKFSVVRHASIDNLQRTPQS